MVSHYFSGKSGKKEISDAEFLNEIDNYSKYIINVYESLIKGFIFQ